VRIGYRVGVRLFESEQRCCLGARERTDRGCRELEPELSAGACPALVALPYVGVLVAGLIEGQPAALLTGTCLVLAGVEGLPGSIQVAARRGDSSRGGHLSRCVPQDTQ
jgi:hypothetical protein